MHIHKFISNFLSKHLFSIGVFSVLTTFTFLAGGFVVANGQTLEPNDSHVVSLYMDGRERLVPSRASTVEEFLEDYKIKLSAEDLIEPVKDTPIDQDNFRIKLYKARPITIYDNNDVKRVLSPHQGSKMIVEKAGIAVYPEDELQSINSSSFVEDKIVGEKITINRATPVTISLYGEVPTTYRTRATTVGQLLSERGIVVEQGAVLNPSAETIITPNMAIFISKFGKQVVTEDKAIDFAVDTTPDPNSPFGRVNIVSPGKKGVKKVTYEIDTRDDKEIGRRVLHEVVAEEPVKQVQTRGTKALVGGDKLEWMIAAGIPADQQAAADFVIGHESGWRPNARNAGGCTGLGQACPGSKLANACPNWEIDPVCQLKFFSGYANGRYGGWNGAYNFWVVSHWW